MESREVEPRELAGWKQIASYLGVTIPTARKWARDLGLPVVQRGQRYFAFTRELDQWRQSSPNPPRVVSRKIPHWSLVGLAASVVVLTAVGIWLAWPSQIQQPPRAAVQNGHLVVLDGENRLIASVPLPGRQVSTSQKQPFLRDVDGDGVEEVFLIYEPIRRRSETGHVTCFNLDGTRRWRFSLGRPLRVGDRNFEPFYVGARYGWIEASEETYLLIVAHHSLWYPSQVVLLEPTTGAVVSEYWHPGFVETYAAGDLDGDHVPELLLGGINNPGDGPGHPSLVVLGIPFSESRGRKNFFGPANAKERHYVLFPQPDVLSVEKSLAAVSELEIQEPDQRISIAIRGGDRHNYLFYYLDYDLNVVDLRSSDYFRTRHNRMRNSGELDHNYDPSELDALRSPAYFPTAPNANKLVRWPTR